MKTVACVLYLCTWYSPHMHMSCKYPFSLTPLLTLSAAFWAHTCLRLELDRLRASAVSVGRSVGTYKLVSLQRIQTAVHTSFCLKPNRTYCTASLQLHAPIAVKSKERTAQLFFTCVRFPFRQLVANWSSLVLAVQKRQDASARTRRDPPRSNL